MKHEVRIGGACGYWGDSAEAPRQLVEKGGDRPPLSGPIGMLV